MGEIDFAWPKGLPVLFTYGQARHAGVSDRRLRQLRDQGAVEQISRGLYQRVDAAGDADVDLLVIARRAPDATLCLATALARHGLTDEIPSTIDVALPRGRHRPVVAAPVTWHLFDPTTFAIGRERLRLDRYTTIGLYGPERCIIDAIRLRHREGSELAIVALRRWLARRGSSPSRLLQMAERFPSAQPMLRQSLEVLL